MKAMWIFLFILAVVALTDATDGCDDRLASCQMYNAQLEVSNAKLKAENAELLRQLDASMNANRQSRLIPAKKEPNESEIQTDADLVVDLWVALCSPAYRIPTMPRNSSHEFMELLTNFETLFETYHRRAVQIDSQTSALSQVVADMLITPKAARGLSVNTNAEGEKIEDIVSEAPETNVKISINNLKSYLRKDDDIFDRVEKRLHDVQLDISKFARLQSLYVEPNSATVNLVESLLFSRLLGLSEDEKFLRGCLDVIQYFLVVLYPSFGGSSAHIWITREYSGWTFLQKLCFFTFVLVCLVFCFVLQLFAQQKVIFVFIFGLTTVYSTLGAFSAAVDVIKHNHEGKISIGTTATLTTFLSANTSVFCELYSWRFAGLMFSMYACLSGAIHYAFSKRQKVYEIYRRVFNGAQPVPVADGDQPVPVEAGDQPVPVEAGDQPMSVENV